MHLPKTSKEHHGNPHHITEVSIDISPAFMKGVEENLPKAAITFDQYHIMKIINPAVDDVRKAEVKEQSLLRGQNDRASLVRRAVLVR